MSLRKNLTVVQSPKQEPNQMSEKVALFNEDGSPYTSGPPNVMTEAEYLALDPKVEGTVYYIIG